jgi:mono/diheme cytochrome c family protein
VRRALLVLAACLWPALPALAAEAPPVADTFQYLCAQCHGSSGDGRGPNAGHHLEVPPANLTDAAYMAKFTDAQIVRTITFGGPANGLSSLMPPWGNRLTSQEILGLVRHIRTLCRCRGPEGEAGPEPGP